MNMIADIKTLYARLGERDYEAVMSYLADDIVWIVADNSPLADRSPYHGIAEVRSGVFERLTAGFDKLGRCGLLRKSFPKKLDWRRPLSQSPQINIRESSIRGLIARRVCRQIFVPSGTQFSGSHFAA